MKLFENEMNETDIVLIILQEKTLIDSRGSTILCSPNTSFIS